MPRCDNLDELNADVAFIGMPFDQGTTARPGARFGPNGIRDARGYRYNGYYGDEGEAAGIFDVDSQSVWLRGVTMADCGDIPVIPSEVLLNFDRLTKAVEKIVERGAFPVVVGGDHAITFPVVRGLSSYAPLDIVHFDAHMDYSHEVQGVLYTHGSPIRRCRELPFVRNITSIGIRRAQKKVYDEALRDGSLIITTDKFKELGAEAAVALVPPSENLYITMDIDVLDQIQAPGTGTPETGGLFYHDVRDALQALARRHRVVAFDIVEVAPNYDWAETTTQTASRLTIDLLKALLPSK